MSRAYDFTFRKSDDTYETVKVRGYGNTLRSAERSARLSLRDMGKDPTKFFRVGTGEFVR